MADVTLEFLGAQIARLLDDNAQLRDDMTVVMGRIDHLERIVSGRFTIVDETLTRILTEVGALRRSDERLARRIERIEGEPAGR